MPWSMFHEMTFGGFGLPFWSPFMFLLMVWSLAWKGLALWHAARRSEPWWFVALLVINTAGILEILYLYAFGGIKEKR